MRDLLAVGVAWVAMAVPAWAAPHVLTVEPSGVVITLPEAWADHFEFIRPGDVALTQASPRVLGVKRQAVTDPAGRSVMAGVNVVTFHAPPGNAADVATFYAATLMARRHWPMTEPLTVAKGGPAIVNSLAFHTHFPAEVGEEMDGLVLFEVNNGMFTEVIVSAPHSVFLQLEPELRGILRGIKVAAR